ncbi:hypothetical protein NWF24_27225 [Variovorax paradoxus]|uniref:hypothetical protein n=1 Tax=Variovorax paradoxus TaxID=34073 RepID=UPI0021ABB10F|nr:hypothetical protein [Variovorax paradoxus]UVH56505.1 hypothetical protein NWF24_27225 [Variovorax paradoxus]
MFRNDEGMNNHRRTALGCLSVLAWFLTMPAVFVAVGAVDQHKFQSITDNIAPITATTLLVWAVWIYWRFVPSAPRLWHRIGYLAAFLMGMCLLGVGALWVTFWVMTAIHGA